MKLTKLDLLVLASLVALIAVELYLKKGELPHTTEEAILALAGVVFGAGLGFKIASLHAEHVTQKALVMAESSERKLERTEQETSEAIMRLTKELDRRGRKIERLTDALRDRDEEVRELVRELERLRKSRREHR